MISDKEYMIRCSRCGSEMKNTARYCLKCGNLNMNHPSNKNMKKFYKNRKEEFFISNDEDVDKKPKKSVNYKNFFEIKICCFLNIFMYLLFVGLVTYLYLKRISDLSMLSFVSSNIYIYYIFISLVFLYLYAIEIVYIKLRYSWWFCFIPFFNLCLLTKRVYDSYLMGLIIIIPLVGWIFAIMLMYKFGKMFGLNGILFVLFPIIYIPVIGYGERLFNNMEFIGDNKNYEKFYSYKKMFLVFNTIVLVVGILMFLFNYRGFFAF